MSKYDTMPMFLLRWIIIITVVIIFFTAFCGCDSGWSIAGWDIK
jgi:hypothetical protein